jgi:hypothetical protein
MDIPKKYTSKIKIQLSASASTASIANTFKDVQNFPLTMQGEWGLGPSMLRLTQNRILVKPTHNKLDAIPIETQIYLPLGSKKCIQSMAGHIFHRDQTELEGLSEPFEIQIISANENILEINKLIAQGNRDSIGNDTLIKAILLQPLMLYQNQILQLQAAIKNLTSSPFTMGSIEDQPQPYSKTIAILIISALTGLVIGAGVRWRTRHFSR